MKLKVSPVAVLVARPAVLPVFDDAWKTKCRACAHFEESAIETTGATMICNAVIGRGQRRKSTGKQGPGSCGYARVEGGCGPAASLFKPKAAKAKKPAKEARHELLPV